MSTSTPILPGRFYHIYNRGINSGQIIFERRNYLYFLQLYAKYMLAVFDTYAYCLLGNHYHLLVRVKTEQERLHALQAHTSAGRLDQPERLAQSQLKSASDHFNHMQIAYTMSINKAYGRTGGLMERPFRRKLVESNAYFTNLVAYIHQNPQKHGIVNDFRDWPWTSYGAFLTNQHSHLQREFVLDWFGSQTEFLEFHDIAADEQMLAPLIDDDFF